MTIYTPIKKQEILRVPYAAQYLKAEDKPEQTNQPTDPAQPEAK